MTSRKARSEIGRHKLSALTLKSDHTSSVWE